MTSLVEIGPVVLEKKIFDFRQCIFVYFVIISPWKRTGPFIWRNLGPLHPRCFVPSLVEIGPVVLKKEIFFVNVFLLFRNYLHLEKGKALHLNKLGFISPKDALCQQTWVPFIQGALYQVWLKLTQWFWRRRWKCEKFKTTTTPTTTTTTTTDNGQILIRKAHLSLRLSWAKSWYLKQVTNLPVCFYFNLFFLKNWVNSIWLTTETNQIFSPYPF